MSFKSFLQNSRFIICAHYINLQKYSKEITENNLIELLEFIKQNNIGYVTFKPELLQSSSRLKTDIEDQLEINKKSLECILNNPSTFHNIRKFKIDLRDYKEELTENDYKRLLEYIDEKHSSCILFTPKQQEHFNNSIFMEAISQKMEKNKAFENFLVKVENFTIDLSEYTEELTEKDFKRLFEHIDNELLHQVIFNSEQQIQLGKSELKKKILDRMAGYKKRSQGGVPPWDPSGSVQESPPSMYFPRKGMVRLKMKGKNLRDSDCEYEKLEKQRELIQRPKEKMILFNLNAKNINKKETENQTKVLLDIRISSIVDDSLIKDYFALKKKKRINFKEYLSFYSLLLIAIIFIIEKIFLFKFY